MQETIGPYVVVRRLGEGGMGMVDLARDTSSGQMVAIIPSPPDQLVAGEALLDFPPDLLLALRD